VQFWLYLPVKFYLSMFVVRVVASDKCEVADDWNADAGVYFLNELRSLRMPFGH
jgi:hypothetical protein